MQGAKGLAAHFMLVPFLLWCIIVVVVYAISIVRLQGSSASVSAAQEGSRACIAAWGALAVPSGTYASCMVRPTAGCAPALCLGLHCLLSTEASRGHVRWRCRLPTSWLLKSSTGV